MEQPATGRIEYVLREVGKVRVIAPMIILVAENEALVAVTLALQLEAAGHRVLGPASTVDHAAALAVEERPDLALVDIDLHHQGDGVVLARELQERWRVPSFFMTGRPEVARAAADAALGVISKPYDLADIDDSLLVAASIINGSSLPQPPLPPSLQLFSEKFPYPLPYRCLADRASARFKCVQRTNGFRSVP